MKKIALLFMALSMAVSGLAAQPKLSALFGYSVFYLPESNQPYVETYLRFDAWSLVFSEIEAERYRATVEVTLLVLKGDTVAYVKKYDLHSPYTNSINATNFTFFDLQRFGLSNGIYDMELSLRDKGATDEPVVLKDKLIVYHPKDMPSMSNVQLMESATPTTTENMLSRNGYDMMPYIDDFVPAEVSMLHPYFEIYNLNHEIGDKPYKIDIYVTQKENGRRIPNIGWQHAGKAATSSLPIFANVDMSRLPSGNYNIVVEVENEEGEAIFKKEVMVMRSNPRIEEATATDAEIATSFAALVNDEETINYYIDALYPISSAAELSVAKELLQRKALQEKQSYLYRFWKSRDGVNPEGRWQEYLTLMKYVEEHFTYPRTPGYRTDRGRVYLQYGPPDFVRDEKNFVGALNNVRWSINGNVTNSYGDATKSNEGFIYYLPYQLWRYNTIPGDYSNRTFLFWDEFRGGYYKLLVSNARGEVITPGWERMLSRYTMEEGAIGEVGVQFERGY
jgi:GWxTD domain-containing protein